MPGENREHIEQDKGTEHAKELNEVDWNFKCTEQTLEEDELAAAWKS